MSDAGRASGVSRAGGTATRVLGVDGGQSAIRLRVSDDPRIVEVDGVSRAEGDAIEAVAHAVSDGWRRGSFQPADRAVLGLTTAPSTGADADRLAGLVGRAIDVAEVWVTDDAVTAHAGAVERRPGVSLVAGTGVACLALPDAGEPRIIGGHGFLLGDEGGAFWLGARGLGAVLRAEEGRGPATTLRAAATRRYGTLDELHVRLHDDPRPVHAIAAFAPDVLDAADDGDPVAIGIVDTAAEALLDVARTGVAWCRAGAPGPTVAPTRLALGGRLLEPGSTLRRRLDDRLATVGLPVTAGSAVGTPLDGAIALGGADDPGPYAGLVHVWTRVAVA